MPSQAERMYPSGPNSDLGNGFGKYPALSEEAWEQWRKLPVKKGLVFAPKTHEDLKGMLEDNPDGFVVHKDNPHINSIIEDADVFTIPQQDHLFVRPKPTQSALTS